MQRPVRRADGRWQIKIPYQTPHGERKTKTVYGKTRKECVSKADEVARQLGKGLDITSASDTLASWAERWLETKRITVCEKQLRNYDCNIRHVLEDIGHLPLTQITPGDIQSVINRYASHNPKTGRPSARQTLSNIRLAVLQVFEYAIECRAVEYNPARYVKLPKTAPKQNRRALTADEQKWIRETEHRAQTAAMIMMYAGLRRGEVIPLTWSDIDLERKTISVNKSVEMSGDVARVKQGAKSAAGERVVDIPMILVEYLSKQSRHTLLVCPNANGNMHSAGSWKRMWESYLQTINERYFNPDGKSRFSPGGIPMLCPPITAHWLRHTFATMLYSAGVDILTAKEQLGHSDIKTTLEIYTHLDKEHKRRSMDKLDAYLGAMGSRADTAEG